MHISPQPTARETWAGDFGPFGGRVWLNAAHQGPLPRVAVDEAIRAIEWKVAPHRIADDAFVEVPRRLRELLGRLIGAPAEEIVLGNSASYGLQILANALPWRAGDEIVVLADEFPATIFPWLVAERRGATVRRLTLDEPVLRAERLERELTPESRVVCVNWVRSLTGHVVDLAALGRVCADAGVHLVVNGTQGIGARPLDVDALPLAAVTSSGFKWLCGPYATGFSWIRPDVLETLEPVQAYWLALPDGVDLDLNREGEHRLRDDLGARAYDVFGTANFLDFMPWAAAVEYLLEQGIEAIAAHDAALVDHLVEAVTATGFSLVSPGAPEDRSTIVVVAHERAEAAHAALAAAGIDVALRAGNIRFSPHLYNTLDEIDRALDVLRAHV